MSAAAPQQPAVDAKDPLRIPEILGIVALSLSQEDRGRCAQVSSYWHSVFQPALWHTFDDTVAPWDTIIPLAAKVQTHYGPPPDNRGRDEHWVRSVLANNIKYIRHLTLEHVLAHEIICTSPECTNLVSFHSDVACSNNYHQFKDPFFPEWEHAVPDMPASFFPTEHTPEFQMDFYYPFVARILRITWQLLLRNPSLEELIIKTQHRTKYLTYMPPQQVLFQTLKSLTHLKRLEGLALVDSDFARFPEIVPLLEKFAPGIFDETFDVDGGYSGDSVSIKGIENLQGIRPKMKSIRFSAALDSRHQAKLLQHMPELRELYIGEFGASRGSDLDKAIHVNADSLHLWSVPHLYFVLNPAVTNSTKNLVEFRLRMLNYGVDGLIELLRRMNPGLQVIDADCFVNYPIEQWYQGLALPTPSPAQMQLQQIPFPQFNLRSLRLSGLSSPWVFLSPYPPNGGDLPEISEDLTARSTWWRCLPHLTEFVAQFVTPTTMVAIADHCPKIEIVDVSLAQKGASSVLHVLTNCAHLKRFIGKGHMLDAEQVAKGSKQWACRDIERLHLEIHGIPRGSREGAGNDLDGAATLPALTITAVELSIAVYERIGQLTRLKDLDLGGYVPLKDKLPMGSMVGSYRGLHRTFEYSGHVFPGVRDTLELSLVSGLGLLSNLKRLERLGVQEVDLCIGQEELSWMKSQWPNLQIWGGLSAFLSCTVPQSISAVIGYETTSVKNRRLWEMIRQTWPLAQIEKRPDY
ncbi:hypothetical protein BG004_005850 [Podila humilis]|nr:hypothetical protein BG004_005850 [Podila humilis]